ncbi:hypothetical protein LTS18_009053, partial [Coniosporium uncinatum]
MFCNPDLSPTSLPIPHGLPSTHADTAPRSSTANPQVHIQQDYGMLGSIPESARPASSHDIMQNLSAAGYAINVMPTMPAQTQMVPFAGGVQWNIPNGFGDDIQGPFGGLSNGLVDNYDFQNYLNNGPVIPQSMEDGNGSVSSLPSSASTAYTPGTLASSTGSLAMPAVSASMPMAVSQCEPDNANMIRVDSCTQEGPNSMWPPAPSQSFSHYLMPQAVYQSSTHSSHSSPGHSPDQSEHNAPQYNSSSMDPTVVLPAEAFSRRSSSTTALAESMSNVGIQTPTAASFKQPTSGSIAARRQRPHPAPITPGALRSASYSAGMPVSPGSNNNLAAPDHQLRRIRSSGIPGGRIQKPSGTAQRSPLHASFSEAAGSPKFARNGYANVNVTSPSNSGTLAPPTPLTPGDYARFPSWQNPRSVKAHNGVPSSSPDAISIPWSNDTAAGMYTHSPPSTPLDAEHMAQYRRHLQGQAGNDSYRDTPPQSAPATQQTFSQS